jgi:hypothetical protein
MLYIFGLIILIGVGCIILWNKSSHWCRSSNPVKEWIYRYFYEDWVIFTAWTLVIAMGVALAICGGIGIYEETAKDTIKQECLTQYTILQYQIDMELMKIM